MDCFALYEQLFKTESTIIATVVNAAVEPSLVDTVAGHENFTKKCSSGKAIKKPLFKVAFYS